MQIPLYLGLAQWALLAALGLLVVTAYRQLGRVLGRPDAPAEIGPAVGSRPGPIGYERLAAGQRTPAGTRSTFMPGAGQPALVAFVDPTCPSCEGLVATLSAARSRGELDGVRVLLLTSDPPGYLQISAAFRATDLEIGRPLDPDDLDAYRPSATPLLVAIDRAGVVAAAGTASRAADVRATIQACLLPQPAAMLPVLG